MKNFTCSPDAMNHLGFSGIYNVCKTSIVEEGQVLISYGGEQPFYFEVARPFNVLTDETIEAVPGSIASAGGDKPSPLEVSFGDSVSIGLCRFPTDEELRLYEESCSI